MDALQALYTRRSCRAYAPDAIPEKDMEAILEAGRLAPTGGNRQSWKFVVVTDPALKRKIADTAAYGGFIDGAYACVCVMIGPDALCPNEDVGSATSCMLVAAHALGYAGCWIGAHDNPAYPPIMELLAVPKGWRMMSLFALGKARHELTLPNKKDLADVVSYNAF